MSGFESVVGQNQPVRIITALIQNNTIPHALLFSGIGGIGKRTVALLFAKALNCTGNSSGNVGRDGEDNFKPSERGPAVHVPCHNCKSCKKIVSENHPDIYHIKPSGVFIRISQIRDLGHRLSMKPYEARFRVVVISNAHTMHPAAGNALLKMLEEPPDRTIFILTAIQISDLLPTIVSRCQHIIFNPISIENLVDMLIDKTGIEVDNAKIIASMANGSFSTALAMGKNNWIDRRNWMIGQIIGLSSKPLRFIMALAEKISADKEGIQENLKIIQSWFRDLIIFKYDPNKIICKDMMAEIQSASQASPEHQLLSKFEVLQTAQENIRPNTNLRLALEVLLLKLAKT